MRLGSVIVWAVALAACGAPPKPRAAIGLPRAITRGTVRIDLDLPAAKATKPPLAIVIEGGRERPVDPSSVRALSSADVAVAWVRFTVDDESSLASCANEVAAAVDDLDRGADVYGFDRARMTLVGYGAGGTIAAMVGLRGLPSMPRVVSVRGTFDLRSDALAGNPDYAVLTAGGNEDERVRSSPILHPNASAPPFLVLATGDDAPGARRFARALENAGAASVESFVTPEGGRAPVDALIASFVANGPRALPLEGPWGVAERWGRAPPLGQDTFAPDRVITSPATGELEVAMTLVFGGSRRELAPWPLREVRSIPLGPWLASRTDVGRGDHLVITNLRGEQLYLTRADLEKHAPVVVVGIDDETNLYRMVTSYQLDREASWLTPKEPMPVMVRPVGPFVLFPHGTPPSLDDTTLAGFGLSPASFRFVVDDPLKHERALPADLRDALIGSHGCLKCHALRGEGARAHHVRAIDGKPHGGFALPLEEYPPEVLHAFLFEQEKVARSFGVTPLPVPEKTAKALFDRVESSR